MLLPMTSFTRPIRGRLAVTVTKREGTDIDRKEAATQLFSDPSFSGFAKKIIVFVCLTFYLAG
jgi:hypothetical protein